MTSMLALMEREYAWEKQNYKVDKRVLNLVSEMGFMIADQEDSMFQRLVKQTDHHLVIVTYRLRPRIINPPKWYHDP